MKKVSLLPVMSQRAPTSLCQLSIPPPHTQINKVSGKGFRQQHHFQQEALNSGLTETQSHHYEGKTIRILLFNSSLQQNQILMKNNLHFTARRPFLLRDRHKEGETDRGRET